MTYLGEFVEQIIGAFYHQHLWINHYDDPPHIVQTCLKCGERRSTLYDMTTGTTRWEKGDYWNSD